MRSQLTRLPLLYSELNELILITFWGHIAVPLSSMKLGVKIKDNSTEVWIPLWQIFVIISNAAWICMSKEKMKFYGWPTLMRAWGIRSNKNENDMWQKNLNNQVLLCIRYQRSEFFKSNMQQPTNWMSWAPNGQSSKCPNFQSICHLNHNIISSVKGQSLKIMTAWKK